MRIKTIWKTVMILLLVAVWIPFGSAAETGSGEEAANLTGQCTFFLSDRLNTTVPWNLLDDSIETGMTLPADRQLGISWKNDTGVDSVFIAFQHEPEHCTIIQLDETGEELSREPCPVFMYCFVKVQARTRTVVLHTEDPVRICMLRAYGEGNVPDAHLWDYRVKKLDYMVFAMHPDDDALFLGAVVPIYGAEQGKEGRIVYCTPSTRTRMTEAQNGAWVMGLRNAPLFGPFGDYPHEGHEDRAHLFETWEVARFVVRLLREHKPEVVFSQDLLGEYGHWQHRRLSKAVLEAAELSADPSYDPYSAELFGVWRVKKLYLHLYPENRIHLPATEPLAAFDGKNAAEVAAEAFACHQSQLRTRYSVRNEGVYSLSDFGLVYTVVGADTPGVNDPFEHVSASDLARLYPAERIGDEMIRSISKRRTELLGGYR